MWLISCQINTKNMALMDLDESWFVHSVWTFTHRQFSVMCCMASDDSWALALSFQYIEIPQVWILQ